MNCHFPREFTLSSHSCNGKVLLKIREYVSWQPFWSPSLCRSLQTKLTKRMRRLFVDSGAIVEVIIWCNVVKMASKKLSPSHFFLQSNQDCADHERKDGGADDDDNVDRRVIERSTLFMQFTDIMTGTPFLASVLHEKRATPLADVFN